MTSIPLGPQHHQPPPATVPQPPPPLPAQIEKDPQKLASRGGSGMESDKEMSTTVIEGNDAVTGHIISTTIGGKNGEPKQTISYMAERVVGTGSFGIVFQGLAYIHTVPGVCHRDVKPQNLLVFHKRMPPEAIDLASRLLQYSSSLRCTVLFLEAQFQLYISLHLHQVQSTPINPNDEEQQDFDDEDD